jgi:hypothetical protein
LLQPEDRDSAETEGVRALSAKMAEYIMVGTIVREVRRSINRTLGDSTEADGVRRAAEGPTNQCLHGNCVWYLCLRSYVADDFSLPAEC